MPEKKQASLAKFFGSTAAAPSKSTAADPTLPPAKKQKLESTAAVQTAEGGAGGVLYGDLCEAFAKIEATTKRLEIGAILTKFLRKVIRDSPGDLLQVVYLSITRIAPDYEGIELGIGESLLMKAIAASTGRSLAQIKQDFKTTGDLGVVAASSRGAQKTMFKPKPLTVASVFRDLKTIATVSGHASQQKKVDIVQKLLASAQGDEAKYIVRSLEGKLRIGLAERSVLSAIATAIAPEDSKADATLKAVFSNLPNYDLVIPALLDGGFDGLEERCKLTPGVPLKPMLAKPTKSIGEVLDRFEGHKFTCEYKYDGERGQIHYYDGQSRIYSRNSEDMSSKYPDIVSSIPAFVGDTTSFVLDGEVVAWDMKAGKMLPFQILATRKRKDVREEDVKVKICYFAFDLLYLNGESLLGLSLRERRDKLRGAFKEVPGQFAYAIASDGETTEEIQTFLEQSIHDSCEGLMVKLLDGQESHYEPSRRSQNWLKIKKDYLSGIGDSLDLVVLGAFLGKGKRLGHYGAFLLGCLAHEGEEEIQSICKIGTGFSDEDLASLHSLLSPTVGPQPSYVTHNGPVPDVWFEPRTLFEVLTADLTLSPLYRAGIGEIDSAKGISLRFPRFIRVRDDKGVEDATCAEQVAEMYRAQAAAQKSTGQDDEFW